MSLFEQDFHHIPHHAVAVKASYSNSCSAHNDDIPSYLMLVPHSILQVISFILVVRMERYVASKQLESLINIMFDGQDVICSKLSRVISLAVRTKKP